MSGNNVVEFTDQNFDQEVLKSEKPVLVDFWAEWCGPCRAMAPTVHTLAEEYANRAKIGKINVDEQQNVAFRYNIRSIPTLLLFKDGQVREQVIGTASKDAVAKLLDKHL